MTTITTTPLEAADACYRCGYALQGIADDQPCPECGLLAQRSRRLSEELYDTHPRWLRRLSRAVWLLLLAIATAFVGPFVVMFLDEWVLGGFLTPSRSIGGMWPEHVQYAYDLAAVLLLWGVWLLTSREGYPPADDADRRLRRWLWWAALPPAAAMLILHAAAALSAGSVSVGLFGLGLGGWEMIASLHTAAFVIGGVGSIPLPLLLFRRLRGLAKRAHSAHLAEHCTIVGVGASSAIAYAVACMFVAEHANDWFGTYWVSRSQGWIRIATVMAAAALLFIFWALYLLIRFAVRFGRASWELKRRWMMHDRSIVIAVLPLPGTPGRGAGERGSRGDRGASPTL